MCAVPRMGGRYLPGSATPLAQGGWEPLCVCVYEHVYEGARAHTAPNTPKCTAALMQHPHAAHPSHTMDALPQAPRQMNSPLCPGSGSAHPSSTACGVLVPDRSHVPAASWVRTRPFSAGTPQASTWLSQLCSPSVHPSPAAPARAFGACGGGLAKVYGLAPALRAMCLAVRLRTRSLGLAACTGRQKEATAKSGKCIRVELIPGNIAGMV